LVKTAAGRSRFCHEENMSKKHKTASYLLVVKDDYVELAEHDGKFKRFWKMLTPYGDWEDPRGHSDPMKHDKSWAERVVKNFKSGVKGYVPVPLGHPKTPAELAEHNKGELVELEARDDGLYGLIEIRETETAEKIENKLLPDVSMAYDDDYQDKKTGKWVGPVLKHIGLLTDPYIKGMKQFEAALSDSSSAAVLFADSTEAKEDNNNEEEESVMTKVKSDRDFEVAVKYTENGEEKEVKVAVGAEVEVPEDQVEAVTKQIADATPPASEDDEDLSDEEKEAKAKELADKEAKLAEREQKLAENEANAEYERLLSEGKIVPAQKDAFIALKSNGSATIELSDGKEKPVSVLLSELFEKVPKGKYLSEEGADNDDEEDDDDVNLTDEEKSIGEDFGNTPEEVAEYKKSQKESK
jgi:hypothetical protein